MNAILNKHNELRTNPPFGEGDAMTKMVCILEKFIKFPSMSLNFMRSF